MRQTDPPTDSQSVAHGARSERRIRAKARSAKRRFLRQQGLRASDLDGIALAYLDGWARSASKVELYDDHDGLHGSREYIACQNSARLWMGKLERRLREQGLDHGKPGDPLAALAAVGRRVRAEAANGNGAG